MEIKDENYSVFLDEEKAEVKMEGELRLQQKEYITIRNLFNHALELGMENLVVDISELKYMNSSGITAFFTFILKVKESGAFTVKIIGNARYKWQVMTIDGFKKAWKEIKTEFV